MSDKKKFGILGTGTIAHQFAEGLKACPTAELHAVASRDSKRAAIFAKRHGGETSYGSYEALVGDDSVDIVYIATPHHRHFADCMLCLEADKPVVCEKPFTVNASQAERVYAVAKERKLFCMEAMWMRFMPLVQEIRTKMQANEIGDVEMLCADFGVPAPADPENRFFNPALGGGALLDRGVYCLSLAQYLLGTPTDVSSQVHIGPTGVDYQSSISLGYENGAIASLNCSLTSKMRNEALVLGSQGSLRLHEYFFRPESLSIERYAAPTGSPAQADGVSSRIKTIVKNNQLLAGAATIAKKMRSGGETVRERLEGNGYNYEAEEAVRCLNAGVLESPHMSWQDSIAVMRTMDQLRAQWGLVYPTEDVDPV